MNEIEIILIAMIAAFVLLRLRSELGSKTGNEPDAPTHSPHGQTRQSQRDTVIDLPGREMPDQADHNTVIDLETDPRLRAGYTDIRRADPDFDPSRFLEGARAVYPMVLEAFWGGDKEAIENLVADDVAGQFNAAIEQREDLGQKVEGRVVSVEKADVTFARMHGAMAEITVDFTSDIVCVTRDKDRSIVSGNPTDTVVSKDIWTFARDTRTDDPNWTLVATRSA